MNTMNLAAVMAIKNPFLVQEPTSIKAQPSINLSHPKENIFQCMKMEPILTCQGVGI